MAKTIDMTTNLSIFPNPVHSNLFINIPIDSMDLVKANITIAAITGRTVKQISIVSYASMIPVSTLANGTYIVTITDGSKKLVSKIVKN